MLITDEDWLLLCNVHPRLASEQWREDWSTWVDGDGRCLLIDFTARSGRGVEATRAVGWRGGGLRLEGRRRRTPPLASHPSFRYFLRTYVWPSYKKNSITAIPVCHCMKLATLVRLLLLTNAPVSVCQDKSANEETKTVTSWPQKIF